MNKTLKSLFLASLVMNLLLLGIILGRVPYGLEGPPTRQYRIEEALKKLPEPEQARFREKFTQIRAAGDPLRKASDAARSEALRLLSAEDFDETAYDRQVSRYQELRDEMFKRMSHAIKQTAKELAPAERRTFAELLRRPPPPPKKD